MQLCAAVGAPDAYAGELPVVFATLRPGAQASAEELMAFTAQLVDEAPAMPKAITVIEHMPMTNVGKIYKPALRALAAAQVAQALVDAARLALGTDPAARVEVLSDEATGVTVNIDAAASQAAQLQVRLQEVLAPLPVKTRVILVG